MTVSLSRTLPREYGVDPLEMISVSEVMTEFSESFEAGNGRGEPAAFLDVLAYADETCRAVAEEMAMTGIMSMPVIDRENGRVCGSVSAHDLLVGRRRAVVRESERRR